MSVKLCVSIVGPGKDEAQSQIQKAQDIADLVEFRWDLIGPCCPQGLLSLNKKPVIFTLRRTGCFQVWKEQFFQLLQYQPQWADVDVVEGEAFFKEIRNLFPKTRFILSMHQHSANPLLWKEGVEKLKEIPADLYKLAVQTNSSGEELEFSRFVREKIQEKIPLVGVSMGRFGENSRILGGVLGCHHTYAYLSPSSRVVEGQVLASDWKRRYCSQRATPQFQILGLIGNPVKQSVGHLVHNHVCQSLDLPGVYLKWQAEKENLGSLIQELKNWPLKGLSVTMPFKKEVIRYLDHLDADAEMSQAVNTILVQDGSWKGFNTDGEGAWHALKSRVGLKKERILILGAGGTARAIAVALVKRGKKVCMLNRSPESRLKWGREIGVSVGSLSDLLQFLEKDWDVLIHTTPVGMTPQVDNSLVPKEALRGIPLVFDVVAHPAKTKLLKEAEEVGCQTVSGRDLFFQQAVEQACLWWGCERRKVEWLMREVLYG